MKFRNKIFLIAFLLIIISINLIGILMINNTFNTNITNITNSCLSYGLTIKDSIQDLIYMDYLGASTATLINPFTISNTCSKYIQTGNLDKIEVSQNEVELFSNFSISDKDMILLMSSAKSDITSYIKEDNNNYTLYTLNKFTEKEGNYKIITAKNINDLFYERESQITFFKKVSIISTLVITIILYVFVLLLTKRIKKINTTLEEISNNNYNVAALKLGNDEIGTLANGVNNMVTSISNNITEIQRISQNRQDFINNLTHEIRTPLTSIIGYSSLITNNTDLDKKDIIDYSSKIHQEGVLLKNISDKLTDLILFENGDKNFDNINISYVLNYINTIFSENSKYKDIKFETDICNNIYILGDKDLIIILINNLVKNSIKACRKNKKDIKAIKICLNENKEIKVIDNGIGISKENMDKIFEPFYTLDKSRNKDISGIGLGLTLCYKICKVHNAKINVESQIDMGTTFTIVFKGESDEEK